MRKTTLALAVAIATLTAGLSHGQSETKLSTPRDTQVSAVSLQFNIPKEQPLGTALRALVSQASTNVMFEESAVAGKTAPALQMQGTLDEALARLLNGSGLQFKFLNPATVVVGPPGSLTKTTSLSRIGRGNEGEGTQGVLRLAQTEPPSPGDGRGDGGEGKKDAQADSSSDRDNELKPIDVNLEKIPEVLVRGSAITNVDIKRTEDDVQPYYILDSKMIEKSGATNVEDFLKQRLTMNTMFQSNSQRPPVSSNGSATSTTSTINLRGLGANETLILIDGRRVAGVSLSYIGYAQPDINGISLSSIERIEVLPSSASAIYGGAAIGGVVNIILKKNFQGGGVGMTYENVTHGNAPQRTINATYGFSLEGGKTRIMLSGHYQDGSGLRKEDRTELFQRGLSAILRNSPSFLYNEFSPFRGATPNITGLGTQLTLLDGTPLNSTITSVPAGAGSGLDLAAGLLQKAGTYNLDLAPGYGRFGLQSVFGLVPLTKSAAISMRREFSETLEAFVDVSVQRNASREYVNDFADTLIVVPAGTPTNPFRESVYVTLPSTQRFVVDNESLTRSATLGLVAHLPRNWSAELDYTASRNSFRYDNTTGDARGALRADIASGALNLFVDTIAHPLDLSAYFSSYSGQGHSTLYDINLHASGPLGSLPGGRPTLTIGLEHRKEIGNNFETFRTFQSHPEDNGGQVIFGQPQTTDSLYLEAFAPLVTDANAMPLLRALELQVAGRSEKYTVVAGTPYASIPASPFDPTQGVKETIHYTSTNPTVGLKYRPTQDLTFRASYAQAFLPPTAFQFLPQPTCGYPCYSILDPQNGQSYDVDANTGGNPNLKPQRSKSWNMGVIWEPQAQSLRGLRLNLEHYKITQPDYIATPAPQTIIDSPTFQNRVTRDPLSGLITFVDASTINAVVYETAGWDAGADYERATSMGEFSLHIGGTRIDHERRQLAIGDPSIDFVGSPFEGGEGKIKANATLNWDYRNWTLGWASTYFGSYRQAYAPGGPFFQQYGVASTFVTDAQGGYKIPSQIVHDFFASYAFNDVSAGRASALLSNLTLQLGIKNVFNTLPPFDASFLPYFYSPYGDPRLRQYRLTIRKSF